MAVQAVPKLPARQVPDNQGLIFRSREPSATVGTDGATPDTTLMPAQTMALLPGSPAIDAGNPSGCTDSVGQLLTTDQRGQPRPDKEDTGGCDMGAYERPTD